jgi:hypothetical protein
MINEKMLWQNITQSSKDSRYAKIRSKMTYRAIKIAVACFIGLCFLKCMP